MMPTAPSVVNKTLGQHYPRTALALRSSLADCPYFPICCSALSIGSLEIQMSPSNGWSSSKIRKMAPETASAETIKTNITVAFGGASTLKPRKITTSHETRMINIGFEIEATLVLLAAIESGPGL
jgi:hypothetical protein